MATAYKKMVANKLDQDRNQDSDDENQVRPRADSDEQEASEHDSALDIEETPTAPEVSTVNFSILS